MFVYKLSLLTVNRTNWLGTIHFLWVGGAVVFWGGGAPEKKRTIKGGGHPKNERSRERGPSKKQKKGGEFFNTI